MGLRGNRAPNKRLARAQHRIRLLQEEIHDYYANFRVSNDLLELRNLVTSAELIVRSALLRHETADCTFRATTQHAAGSAQHCPRSR